MNSVILMGNLTRDPEVRHTSGNASVANTGIAVNRKYRTQAGETKEEVVFVDLEAWGKVGEVLAQYTAKGRRIVVEGRLKQDQWQDSGGTKRSKLKVIVNAFHFADAKPDNAGGGSRTPSQPRQQNNQQTTNYGVHADEIPF